MTHAQFAAFKRFQYFLFRRCRAAMAMRIRWPSAEIDVGYCLDRQEL